MFGKLLTRFFVFFYWESSRYATTGQFWRPKGILFSGTGGFVEVCSFVSLILRMYGKCSGSNCSRKVAVYIWVIIVAHLSIELPKEPILSLILFKKKERKRIFVKRINTIQWLACLGQIKRRLSEEWLEIAMESRCGDLWGRLPPAEVDWAEL